MRACKLLQQADMRVNYCTGNCAMNELDEQMNWCLYLMNKCS